MLDHDFPEDNNDSEDDESRGGTGPLTIYEGISRCLCSRAYSRRPFRGLKMLDLQHRRYFGLIMIFMGQS